MDESKNKENKVFISEFEKMNLSSLIGKQFLVAVSCGDKNEGNFLCSTVKGPYTFLETVEEIGYMWEEYQNHAKVYIAKKDRDAAAEFLDDNTVDYIEAHYTQILVDSFVGDTLDDTPYTCDAGIIVEKNGLKDE